MCMWGKIQHDSYESKILLKDAEEISFSDWAGSEYGRQAYRAKMLFPFSLNA